MAAAAAAAAASRCSELLAVGKCPEGSPLSLISKLRTFELKEIGSKEWLQQQAELEQLSAALHEEAISGGPETTLQCFCGTTKVGVLIEEIISIDLWKEKVLPFLKEDSRASSFAFYLPVYYEALLASILEILLFNPLAAAAAEAQLPDLVEYCHRKLQNMLLRSTGEGAAAAVDPAAAAAAAAASAAAAQQQQEADVAFAVEMCCLSILRFICDSRKDMQMTVTTLLYEQYDVLLALTALLEQQPWRRRTAKGDLQVYEDQQWKTIDRGDVRITKAEAQVWLTVYSLVMDPDCKQRYELTSFRRDNLLRLRRHLNEMLYDQLPPLKNLHHHLELMSLDCANLFAAPKTGLLISVQPELRERLLQQHGDEWASLAAAAKQQLSSSSGEEQQQALRGVAEVMAAKLEMIVAKCRRCGHKATKRCSRCRYEAYCSKECQQADWRVHRHACKPAAAAAAAAAASAAADGAAAASASQSA